MVAGAGHVARRLRRVTYANESFIKNGTREEDRMRARARCHRRASVRVVHTVTASDSRGQQGSMPDDVMSGISLSGRARTYTARQDRLCYTIWQHAMFAATYLALYAADGDALFMMSPPFLICC